MPRINPALIQRLKKDLGVEIAAVYKHINKVVSETHLERHHAALYLARQHDININKYSTAEDRAQLRHALRRQEVEQVNGVAQNQAAASAPVRLARKAKGKRSNRKPVEKSVFVVHGRDQKLTKSIYQLIRALGLQVLEWNHAVKAASRNNPNPNVYDIVDKVMAKAGAVVVLLSPDDEVKLKDQFVGKDEKQTEGKPHGQARPNVLFEAGLALGLHQEKTLLVQVGTIKPFSDVGGKHILHLNNSSNQRNEFANRLEGILGTVDRTGADWQEVGDFVPTKAPM
jgi:predicted nucleotide-binding protein